MFLVSFVFILLGTWPPDREPCVDPRAAAAARPRWPRHPRPGLDNLTVPIAAALVFFWVSRMMG